MLKRILSLFLSIVMVLSCVPFQALATEVTEEPTETVQIEETQETLPEETEEEVTEPEVTEPEVTEPEVTESESIESDVPGLYAAGDPAPIYEYLTVGSFEELKALAAQTYSQRTVVYYEGEEPLVITEDLVLPSFFVLDLTGYYSCGRMEIVQGATLETSDFSNELVVGEMIVNGHFVGRGYTRVSDYLEVNGSVYLTADMRLDQDTVVIGGHNVECADNIQLCKTYDAHSAEEFADIMQRAIADIQNHVSYQIGYWVNPGEDHVLREDVLVPANVRLSMGRNYDSNEVFTVAEGVTLTMESVYGVGFGGDVVIHGHLENDAKALYVNGKLTFSETGSYDGDGMISRFSEDTTEQLSDWLVGLDLSNLYVVEDRYPEYGYVEWTLKSKASLTKLPTPTGLVWNKAVEYSWDQNFENVKEKLVTQNGSIAWDMTGSYEGNVEVEFFHEDGTPIFGFSTYFGLMEGMKMVSTNEFAFQDVESGGYYFTVRFLGDGINYGDSDVAVSDTYTYKRPDKVLGICTDLSWNWPATDWKGLKNHSGSYEVEFYYAPTADAEQKLIYKDYGYADYYRPTLWEYMIQENGAGYYFFRVRAISDDIEKTRNGGWSEMSPAYILDPVLESIKSRLDSISTKADDQIIRDAVQAIGVEDLAYAIRMDSSVLTQLEKLETAVGGAAKVQVSDAVPQLEASKITVLGANLNTPVDASKPISLVLDAPMMNNTLSEEYDADVAVSFSMSLENTEYQAVPVKVTLPVPANINLEQLVLLHYNVYGGVEEYTLRDLEVTQKNGTTFVSLMLTNLGDFVLTNYAAMIVDSGIVGKVNWELNSWGELRLFGEGRAVIYVNYSIPWKAYADQITSVVVEDGVTEIGDDVFSYLPNLRSVSLPNTLIELGNWVFAGCTSLETITLPASLEFIGHTMFVECTALKEIHVEEGNERIFDRDGVLFWYVYMGEYDDQDVYSLNIVSYPIGRQESSYVLPKDVECIRYGTFMGAKNLEEIILPDSLSYVESYAFNYTGLKEITIPASVEYFESEQFLGCGDLETITFLGDVPEYSDYCLEDVTATVYYPAGNETWTEEVFESFRGDITWVKSDYIEITGESAVEGGKSVKLTAQIMPDHDKSAKITWELAEGDEEYATLKASGSTATITAVDVSEPHVVTVTASSAEGIAPCEFELTIQPQVKELKLYHIWWDENDEEQWQDLAAYEWWYWTLDDYMRDGFEMYLVAEFWPEGSDTQVTWSSSNSKVATVNEYGVACFTGKTGTTVITATAENGVKASFTQKVIDPIYNVEPVGDTVIKLMGGQSSTLKVINADTEKPITGKNIEWSLWMPDGGDASAYAAISSSGKLTTKKVVEEVSFYVYADVLTDEVYTSYVEYEVILYPAATHVELSDEEGRNLAGETILLDVDEAYGPTFTAKVLPDDAMPVPVKWEIGKAKWVEDEETGMLQISDKYATYTLDPETNELAVSDPTGKAGTVTIKATAQDGSKKSATVKIKFGIMAEDVEITNKETELVSGKSLSLKAKTVPAKVSTSGIIWSLADPADAAYVKLSGSKITAQNIYEERDVTLIAASKDGNATAEYTITIKPKDPGALCIYDAYTGQNVTKSTLYSDLSEKDRYITLVAKNLADGSEADVKWSWKKNDSKYDIYESEDGLEIFMGTASSVTITAKEGKRTATVTIKAAYLGWSVDITTKDGKNIVYDEEGEKMIQVASGKSVNLQASVMDRNSRAASNSKVTWSILEGSGATISSSGKLTADKNVTSTQVVWVRATAADGSGAYGDIPILVKPLATGIEIYSELEESGEVLFSLYNNGRKFVWSNTSIIWDMTDIREDGSFDNTFDIDANVYPFYEDDEARSAIQAVNWKSSSTKVASIDTNGTVTCYQAGTTTITATAADGSGQKISFKLTVQKGMNSLSLQETADVAGGKSITLKPIIEPLDTTNKKLTWGIYGDTSFAKIDQKGKLTTKKVTSVKTVYVYVWSQDNNELYAECKVTIWPKAVTEVKLFHEGEDVTGKSITLSEQTITWMELVTEPSGKSCPNVTWKSSDPESVSVDENGIITAYKATKKDVTITCTAADGSNTKATVKIKVVK